MTAEPSSGGPGDRAARLRALQAAQSVAFRHVVARLRGDLERVLGCRLTAADARGGRVELEMLDERGARVFADLGVASPDSRRGWFPLLAVAALIAKRKGENAAPEV